MTKSEQADLEGATRRLLEILDHNSSQIATLTTFSLSGATRIVEVFAARAGGDIWDITLDVASVLRLKVRELRINGCRTRRGLWFTGFGYSAAGDVAADLSREVGRTIRYSEL